jgi:hypothetical protein
MHAQVNNHGNVLLDLFVKPKEKVTDYRTQFSGIRPQDIKDGVSVEEASRRVHGLLEGCVVVGHAVHNDFKVRLVIDDIGRLVEITATRNHLELNYASQHGSSRLCGIYAREAQPLFLVSDLPVSEEGSGIRRDSFTFGLYNIENLSFF